jgi:hypothetical protein
MGVDWYSCNYCGDTFSDAGYFKSCECGNKWCSDECAEADGRIYSEDEESYELSCNYCRGEDFSDYELLQYLMARLGISTREEVVKAYKEENE